MFKPFVQDGSKTHTIRAERKIPVKAGEVCHCYTGLRQKGAELLGRWRCVKVQDIHIWQDFQFEHPWNFHVSIDGEMLDRHERDALAWRDGFRSELLISEFSTACFGSFSLMVSFWMKEHKGDGNLDFHGQMIHWDFAQPVKGPRDA